MTEKKQSTKQPNGNAEDAIETFRDLVRLAAKSAAASGDEAMAEAAKEAAYYVGFSEDGGGVRLDSTRSLEEARLTKKRSQAGENHDVPKPPPKNRINFGPASPRTVDIAEELLLRLAELFEVPVPGGPDHYPPPRLLGSLVRQLMAAAQPRHEVMCRHADGIERAYEGLTGHKYGEREWWEGILETQLTMNERHRRAAEVQAAEDRKRARRGERRPPRPKPVELFGDHLKPDGSPVGALDRFVNGAEILAFLRHIAATDGRPLPRELTAAAIDGMIGKTGLGTRGGGRGGGRKPASTVVAEWKASRGNSSK